MRLFDPIYPVCRIRRCPIILLWIDAWGGEKDFFYCILFYPLCYPIMTRLFYIHTSSYNIKSIPSLHCRPCQTFFSFKPQCPHLTDWKVICTLVPKHRWASSSKPKLKKQTLYVSIFSSHPIEKWGSLSRKWRQFLLSGNFVLPT
jgi:hypothetical protein